MIYRRVAGYVAAFFVVLSAWASSPPSHPKVDAPDVEWNQWQDAYGIWFQKLSRREKNETLAQRLGKNEGEPSRHDWKLEARYRGLTWVQIQQLGDGGVVGTGRPYSLSDAMEKPMESVFVTSDMLLHAYSRMTADFVRGMDMQRAPKLHRTLQAIWEDLPRWAVVNGASAERARPAILHAQRVIGTALLCLGAPVEFADPALERDCQMQRQLILAAAETSLPTWLAPNGDFLGIDYQRMKPVGLYAENETLTGLFHAVRWLQAVPFRLEIDTELMAFGILAELADKSGLSADVQMQRQWLGLPNCLTVAGQKELSDAVISFLRRRNPVQSLEVARALISKMAEPVHANDNRRFDPEFSGKREKLSPILKIMPAYLTADSLLFSEIMNAEKTRLPEGRMITAYLGDRVAIAELNAAGWNSQVLAIIEQAAARQTAAWLREGNTASVVHPYDDRATFNSLLLQTWAALFMPPAKGAPPFLSSPAWRAKSRNTVLSAWAEKKHTWVLHEVEPQILYGSAGPPPPPPGLIEPNPEFFRRLRFLTEKTVEWMEQHGYFAASALPETARADATERLKAARYIRARQLDLPGSRTTTNYEEDTYDRYGLIPKYLPSESSWRSMKPDDFSRLRESLIKSAEALLLGLDQESRTEEIEQPPIYRRERWRVYLEWLKRLEAMAAKQLREEPWTEEEAAYLIFGVWNDYYACSALLDCGQKPDPKSLGPKIAPVGMNPNTNEVLQVGTGDMTEIYVLYPWKGASFLYRGPIMPYYEFVSPKRLNDEEWRALLKSSNPPRQPAWLEPLWK